MIFVDTRTILKIENNSNLWFRLMQKLGQADMTAMLFKEYATECEAREPGDKSELCRAYKFLASHCLRTKQLTDAYNYAQKCLAYEEVSTKSHQKLAL